MRVCLCVCTCMSVCMQVGGGAEKEERESQADWALNTEPDMRLSPRTLSS